jgi:NADP-dependent 3-hydroxy acid dehydrogenase YdfG
VGDSGIGLATAKSLAAESAQVVIASRSMERLEKARKNIGRPVEIQQLDIREEQQVADFFSELERSFTRCRPLLGNVTPTAEAMC